jgi:protein O-mannosyl-transferase
VPAADTTSATRRRQTSVSNELHSPRNTTVDPVTRRRLTFVIAVALALCTFLVYSRVCRATFVLYDDELYVFANPKVLSGVTGAGTWWAFTSFYAANWHPLTWLSLQLDAELFGRQAWGFHLTNLLLHIANSVLLFLVLQRLTGNQTRSAVVAALFALHPLHVESVAWVAERKDVLSTLFWLLTLAGYAHYVENPSWCRYLLVAAPFALGLLAKPMLVTLPFVLLLLDYWPLRRLSFAPATLRRLLLEKSPLFALSAVSCVVTWYAQQSYGAVQSLQGFPLEIRVGNALLSYVVYLRKTVWPVDLAVLYLHPGSALSLWQAAAAGVILLAATALILKGAARFPYLAVGWLWYLGTLIPVIGLVQVGIQGMADRYTYVPLIGVFVAVTWAIADLTAHWHLQRVMIAFTAVILITCAVYAWIQVRYWQDDVTLWQHTLQVTPNSMPAHKNLAEGLRRQGRLGEAMREYQTILAIDPEDSEAHNNLGYLLVMGDDLEGAIVHFRLALRMRPDYAEAKKNLAQALKDLGYSQ